VDGPQDGPTDALPASSPARVVFVPGLGLDGREWDGVRRRLHVKTGGGGGDVVLLPSLGRSAASATDLRVEAAAEQLVAGLSMHCAQVVLVGHSASCPVVIEAALRCTAAEQRLRVTGLVLVGPVTDPRAATWPRMLREWARTALHERLWELPILLPQYYRTGVPTMVRGMNAKRDFRSDLALARTNVPVTVTRGQHDRIAPLDWCQHLVKVAAGPGTVTSVPGAAHMVPLTHPEAVVSAIQLIQAGDDGPNEPTAR